MTIKNDVKNILRELLRTAASDIFIDKCLMIIEESADNKESLIAAADKISKRIGLFIDVSMAENVLESLKAEIEKSNAAPGTKRRYERVNVPAKVHVTHNGTPVELSIQTISLEGMYIRTDDPCPVGTKVEIMLPMATGRPIHLRGVVIYIKNYSLSDTSKYPSGMAVNFREITDDEFNALRDYMKIASAQRIVEPRGDAVL
jgi:hypothetical protein